MGALVEVMPLASLRAGAPLRRPTACGRVRRGQVLPASATIKAAVSRGRLRKGECDDQSG
jgi:hypothetical protein